MSCICGELLNTGKRGKKNRNRQHEELRVVDLWFLIICQCWYQAGKKTTEQVRLPEIARQSRAGRHAPPPKLLLVSIWKKTARESRSCLTVWLHPTVLPKRSCRGAEPWWREDWSQATHFKQSYNVTQHHTGIIQESYSPSERSCCIKGPSSSPGAIFNHPKALAHSSTAPRQGCRRGMQWLSFLLHFYHENGHSMLEQAVISIELNPRKIQGESRSEYCQSHVLSFCLKTQMLNLTLILPRIATACSNDFLIAAPTGSPRHWCRNLPGHLAAHRQVTSAVPPPRGSRWSICWYLEKKKGE